MRMVGPEKITQELRALVAAPGDLDLVPGTHTYGGSQPSVTLVPEDPVPTSDLHGHWACTRCTDISTDKTLIHMKDFCAHLQPVLAAFAVQRSPVPRDFVTIHFLIFLCPVCVVVAWTDNIALLD